MQRQLELFVPTLYNAHTRTHCHHPAPRHPTLLPQGCSHQFKWLSNGAIQYVPTGKCLHPKEGSVSYLNQASGRGSPSGLSCRADSLAWRRL